MSEKDSSIIKSDIDTLMTHGLFSAENNPDTDLPAEGVDDQTSAFNHS